ncbi:hypothetical protein EIP86_000012 [Pleurotus ostreatoroseus]|nr:hypothetical protein EIP86_000012 [Pleurotus ostreatoroseus]
MASFPPSDDSAVCHGSPQQLADALVATLSPSDDMRRTRDTYTEDELERVELSLLTVSRSLNSIKNAFAPINSLPRETLGMIFSILAASCAPDSNSFLPSFRTPSSPPSHEWTVVAHVCRYWRDTALLFPTLWSTIDTSCPLAALASLDRAAQAPIHAYLRDAVLYSSIRPSLERGRFLQSISAHTSQLAELHVQPTFRYGPAVLRYFDRPAPQLRALSIALGASEEQDKTLSMLFGGETPVLTRLTLFNFARWHEGWDIGKNLTHLCLYDQPVRSRLQMSEFLDLLAGCTRLEELVVVEAGPSTAQVSTFITSPDADPKTHIMLDMPHLRRLHLGNWGSPRIICGFLSHLVLPATTTMEIWGDVLFHSTETLFSLLPSSLSYLLPLHNLNAIHLKYRPTLKDAPQLFSVSNGVLVVHFYYIANTSSELLASVFNMLDVRSVRELTVGVDCDPDLTAGWWKDAFASMPKLSQLNIVRRRSRAILAALTLDQERRSGMPGSSSPNPATLDTSARDETQIPCPALKAMVITDDSALASIRLFALAQERAAFGMPIQSLTIVNATAGLGSTSWDAKMREEIEDLKCYIKDVRVAREDIYNMPAQPVGWPSEPFTWAMRRKEAKGTSHRAT